MYVFSQVFAFASFASGAGLSTILWAVLSVLLLTAIVLKIFLKFKVSFKDSDNNSLIFEGEYKWLHRVTASDASKNGKKFIGWSKSEKGGKCLDSNSFIVRGNTVLYAIWENSAEVINASDAGVATLNSANKGAVLELSYLDDGNNEISNESFSLNCKFPVVQKDGKEFLGWAFAPGAGTAYDKDCKDIYFVLRLYPVYSQIKPEGKENKSINFELIFKDSYSGDEIAKYSFDIQPNAPVLKDGDKVFVGWGVEPDSDTVIGKNVDASSVVVELFTSFEGDMPEVPEEPAQEEVVEEPVQEEVVEEPVQEEVAEEPVQEEVVEEPVQEEVVEEPVQEEIVEEPVQEEVVEEPVQEEVVEEPVQEEVVKEPVEAYDANVVFVPTYFDSEGNKINIKYSRSVTANIIQSDDTVKHYYSELKNHILSYKGVKSRISWKFDSFNRGRDQLFKLKLRGKTVLLYCALDPNDIDKSKYHHDAVDNKLFADVPTLLKVKSGLGLRKAKEIIDAVMAKFGIEKSDKPKTVNYVKKYPYEETEALLEKKLVKKLVSDNSIVKVSTANDNSKEEPQEDNNVVVEEIPAEVVEEPVQEEVVEEPVQEEIIEEPAQEEPVEEEITVVESVDATEADNLVSDKKATSLVEEDVEYISEDDFKKDIVNIDTLSENFNSGDVVTLKKLKEKKLVHAKTKFVKVLARGRIDKPLTVKAGEFSNTALKMILLTGGKAIHSRYEVK